jgi:hypothetical protein
VIIRIQGEAIPAVEDSEVVILVGKITGDSSWIMLGQQQASQNAQLAPGLSPTSFKPTA